MTKDKCEKLARSMVNLLRPLTIGERYYVLRLFNEGTAELFGHHNGWPEKSKPLTHEEQTEEALERR